jgi:K+-sensing histidine kinase KdpD
VFGAADAAGRPDPAARPGLSYGAVEHDLKTPLTSIRSLAVMLLDCPDLGEDERRRFLGVLVQENERLGRVVKRLLGEPGLRKALG